MRIATGPEGVYTYIGVAGGVVAEAVLGSCATDALSGIGPAPLAAGDVFTVGVAVGTLAAVDVRTRTAEP